jgi:hypothetical protein
VASYNVPKMPLPDKGQVLSESLVAPSCDGFGIWGNVDIQVF